MSDQVTRAVNALFEAERRQLSARRADDAYPFGRVLVDDGSSRWTFERDVTGTWRLTYVTTFGNGSFGSGSFITGQGRDTAGYVITNTATIDRLNGTLARLGK